MSLLKWDQVGERTYETGCDHGVLYPQVNGTYPKGYSWSGLTNVTKSPSGAEPNDMYADNMKYLSIRSAEDFGATIECLTYPPEFAACNGQVEAADGVMLGQQRRTNFGFCWRTRKGNDTEGDDYGYKIHIIYNASVSPSEEGYETVNDSPEAITFSYEVTTTPIPISILDSTGKAYRPTATLVIDSTKADPDKMKELEDILYGTDGEEGKEARLPLPDEILTLFAAG